MFVFDFVQCFVVEVFEDLEFDIFEIGFFQVFVEMLDGFVVIGCWVFGIVDQVEGFVFGDVCEIGIVFGEGYVGQEIVLQ